MGLYHWARPQKAPVRLVSTLEGIGLFWKLGLRKNKYNKDIDIFVASIMPEACSSIFHTG
jgi:hypothetical protein